MKIKALLLIEVTCFLLCKCEHLIIGDSSNKDMVYHTAARYPAIPYKRRVENIFYSNQDQKKIKVRYKLLIYILLSFMPQFTIYHTICHARLRLGGIKKLN